MLIALGAGEFDDNGRRKTFFSGLLGMRAQGRNRRPASGCSGPMPPRRDDTGGARLSGEIAGRRLPGANSSQDKCRNRPVSHL
ncbi:hypothetical protein NHU_02236 [Rhodovulum sulfidophilum]|uniref:Uncharacterized protein n=1 Tax=Rhodovulum sulfidophilum TaxID=35806 RepID=A0A0D6B3V5_RHOSU|nr:hypothetical protein NHU_02236 [Rhodovulum sulfidophilum]